MNRIDMLIKQSTDDIMGVAVLDQKRFARLIVQECLDIINDEGDWAGGSIRAMKKIKEHFGIKIDR